MSKTQFIELARKHIKRDGIEELLNMLEKTDFFSAPASTRYHGNYRGGLVDHSINVFQYLMDDIGDFTSYETIAIVALFHDVCKIGMYSESERNTKDEHGKWIKVPYYEVIDQIPLGHGEKSMFMINDMMKLTTSEAMAIRWHMGGYEPKENYGTLSKAMEMYPLIVYLHSADLKATYIADKRI